MDFGKSLSHPIEIIGHAWVLTESSLAHETYEEEECRNKLYHFHSWRTVRLGDDC